MAELSPAAQAVLDAFNREARPEPHHQREAIAAALCAAACLERSNPWGARIESTGARWMRDQLLAIAAELRGGQADG